MWDLWKRNMDHWRFVICSSCRNKISRTRIKTFFCFFLLPMIFNHFKVRVKFIVITTRFSLHQHLGRLKDDVRTSRDFLRNFLLWNGGENLDLRVCVEKYSFLSLLYCFHCIDCAQRPPSGLQNSGHCWLVVVVSRGSLFWGGR